jgi:hypothetical protein
VLERPLARYAGHSLPERGGRPEDPKCRFTEIFHQLRCDYLGHRRFETGALARLRRRADARVHQHPGGLQAGSEFADQPPLGRTMSRFLRIFADLGQRVVQQPQDCRGVLP